MRNKSRVVGRFSPEEDEQIHALYNVGLSGFAIAKKLGRSDGATYQRMKRLGLKPNKNKPRAPKAKKLTVANAALRRVNGKGPKVKLTVITGRQDGAQPRLLRVSTFNNVEAAQKFVTSASLDGKEVHLYKEIEFELTAELKGRVE